MRMKAIALVLLCVLLTACSAKPDGPTWQEQYDLGLRYLEEGNYEEAILAFTAAIEIDPKQAPAYIGRGDAYVLSGKTEENLTAALADYKAAIVLDDTLVEVYLGIASIYTSNNDISSAIEILEQGFGKTQNETIKKRMEEFKDSLYAETVPSLPWCTYYPLADGCEYYIYDADNKLIETNYFRNNELWQQKVYTYDVNGNLVEQVAHVLFDSILDECWYYTYYEYDSDGRLIKETYYEPESLMGEITYCWIYEYDSNGLLLKKSHYFQNNINNYDLYEYNSEGKIIKMTSYTGTDHVIIKAYKYDTEGRLIEDEKYNYIYNSNGNVVEKYVSDESGNRSEYDCYYTYVYDTDGILSIERKIDPRNGMLAETVYEKQVTHQ